MPHDDKQMCSPECVICSTERLPSPQNPRRRSRSPPTPPSSTQPASLTPVTHHDHPPNVAMSQLQVTTNIVDGTLEQRPPPSGRRHTLPGQFTGPQPLPQPSPQTTMPPSSTSTASADSGTQTDDTTIPIDVESPTRPTTTNASTQTNYRQATTAVQTQPRDDEHPHQVAEETACEEGYEKGRKEGLEAGLQCGMTAERIVWNGYHGPNLCVQTQVQKTDGATQMEHHPSMDSSAQIITQIQPLDDECSCLTNLTPPVVIGLQHEFQSSRSALLHDELAEPPEQKTTTTPPLVPEPS
jgi:hypothetical protein